MKNLAHKVLVVAGLISGKGKSIHWVNISKGFSHEYVTIYIFTLNFHLGVPTVRPPAYHFHITQSPFFWQLKCMFCSFLRLGHSLLPDRVSTVCTYFHFRGFCPLFWKLSVYFLALIFRHLESKYKSPCQKVSILFQMSKIENNKSMLKQTKYGWNCQNSRVFCTERVTLITLVTLRKQKGLRK